MPAVGDQHKDQGPATANPFDDKRPQPTPYTAAEISTLQARLDKQLGPEYISARPGPSGGKVHYLAGEKVINLANEVFGFNGWSSAVQNIQIDFVDEHAQTGKITLGLSVLVRVTLKDGTYHEDIGYGHVENCKGKAAAFNKAKKEGTTDALKRALRTFGRVLGNCVYDKEFLARITKMKVGKGRWDENELYRHADFAPTIKKEESAERGENRYALEANVSSTTEPEMDMDESFDITDFDDAEFGDEEFGDPDQFVLPDTISGRPSRMSGPNQPMGPPARHGMTTPSRGPSARTATAPPAATRPMNVPLPATNQLQQRQAGPPGANQSIPMAHPPMNGVGSHEQQHNSCGDHYSSSPGVASQHFAPPNGPATNHNQQQSSVNRPAAFYSARAADLLDQDNNLVAPVPVVPAFNPHADSPSIRKTAGVSHNKSGPLRRDTLVEKFGVAVPGAIPPPTGKDIVDPRSDQSRRQGIPGQPGVSSAVKPGPPGFSTSAYRPPSRRGHEVASVSGGGQPGGPGGVDRVLTAAKRAPLGDVSNVHPQHSVTVVNGDGGDAKRMRLTGPGVGDTTALTGQADGAGDENSLATTGQDP